MILSIIVAISENNAIGKDNQLLWHLPADLKHFKEITTGHSIVMGRKTYESIGRPLPNRRNIVITRQSGLQLAGSEVVNSIEEAISVCKDEQEVFIIGGAEIYQSAIKQVDRIYLTTVHEHFKADAFFPILDKVEWHETFKEYHSPDEKNAVAYTFSTLERKS